MKKVLTLLILLIGFSAFSQVSLKGYKLGKKMKGESMQELKTSVAGIPGTVYAYGLDDNQNYQIIFFPGDHNGDILEPRPLYEHELLKLVKGIEKKYEVELEYEEYSEESQFKSQFHAIKEGVEYVVLVHKTKDEIKTVGLTFYINSIELMKLHEEEQLSDF